MSRYTGWLPQMPFTDNHQLNLDWIISRLGALKDSVADSKNWSRQSEAWASGEIDGEPVSSDTDQYRNNAKFYSSLSEDHAGDSANFSEDSEAWAIGTKNNSPVGNSAAQYQNNSKYYAEVVAAQQGVTAAQDWMSTHLEAPADVVIDDTLTISGAAADAKTVGDGLNGLGEKYYTISAEEGYITATGTVSTWYPYGRHYTSYVEIEAGDVFKIVGIANTSENKYIAYYDENQTFISAKNLKNIADGYVILTAPSNTHYFRFTLEVNEKPTIFLDFKSKIAEVYNDIGITKAIALGGYTEGKFINASGGLSTLGGMSATDFIEIRQKYTLIIHNLDYSTDGRRIAFYDKEQNFIKAYAYTIVENETITIQVPEHACYTRFSFLTSKKPTLEYDVVATVNNLIGVAYKTSDNPITQLIEGAGFADIFNSVMCIGDSLTLGGFEWGTYGTTSLTDIREYSYPTHLAEIINARVENRGWSGAVASSSAEANNAQCSWTLNYGIHWENEINHCEAYIIALGSNDVSYYGSFTGNVETDLTIEDYNPTTGVGNSVTGYCSIIRKIKNAVPRAKIFVCTIPYTRGTSTAYAEANEKIRAIAEHFNCYLIDLEKYYVLKSEVSNFKAKYYNLGHLNVIGYSRLAKVMVTYIDYIINQQPTEFFNVPITFNLDYDV